MNLVFSLGFVFDNKVRISNPIKSVHNIQPSGKYMSDLQ